MNELSTCIRGFLPVIILGVLMLLLVHSGRSEYANSSATYFSNNFNEGFHLTTRIPKKPFTKKNNILSFETKTGNIEVSIYANVSI